MTSLRTGESALTFSLSRAATELLKSDTLGRLRVSRERRQALLAEFDQSGISAAQFAKLAGIKYSTFAQWVQRYRRRRSSRKPTRRSLRLVEAVVTPAVKGVPRSEVGLWVQLPGGVRMELACEQQAPLVAALIQALAARC